MLACVLVGLLVPVASAQEGDGSELVEGIERDRLAQTGMKFLSVSLAPRAAAMGDAVSSHEASSLSMFYNPAGMGYMTGTVHAAFGVVQWVGAIDYNMTSVAFRPAGGRYGVIGLSLMAADYGDFRETIRYDNDSGYLRLGTYSPTAYAVGLGYARGLTDRFAVGGNLKYARQSLVNGVMNYVDDAAERRDFAAGAVVLDFGVLYRTGFRSLNFAMSLRNLSREVTYAEESFELPLTFRIGMSMNMVDLTSLDPGVHALLLSVDAERPRDYAEQIKAGLEYTFMNTLALRAGYIYPTDEQGVSLGAGVQSALFGVQAGFDYAYTQFGLFGNVNRLAVQLGL